MFNVECVFYKVLNLIASLLNIKKINTINSDFQYRFNIKKLSRKGVNVGDNSLVYNCVFSSSKKGDHFYIGNDCTLTGATFLAHDASPTLFLSELQINPKTWQPGSRLSYRNPIKIGDNVFIGYGAIIMPGVEIGSNVIVGAGSVVTKNIESNMVVAGNPARVVNSIDNYTNKYKEKYNHNPEMF